MQFTRLFTTTMGLSSAALAQGTLNDREKELIAVQMTLDSVPPSMMAVLRSLPEDMMRHEAKVMQRVGMVEVAAGAALMHRGMDLLHAEMRLMYAMTHNMTTSAPREVMPTFNESELHGSPPLPVPAVEEQKPDITTSEEQPDTGRSRWEYVVRANQADADEEEEEPVA